MDVIDWADADDPIEELHKIRRQLIEEAGGTIHAYMQKIMEEQKKHPERYVDLSKEAAANAKKRLTARKRKAGQKREPVA